MSALKEKINPYLALGLVLLVGLVFTFLILASLNQPKASGLLIDRQAAKMK